MTVLQDGSDGIDPSGPEDAVRRPRAAPAVDAPAPLPAAREAGRMHRFAERQWAVAASLALHAAIFAFFLTGPGRHLGSALLSGARDRGIASIGDAAAENPRRDGATSAQDRAISVFLAPPPPPAHPTRSGNPPAPARPAAADRGAERPKAPPVLSARTAAKGAARGAAAQEALGRKAALRPPSPSSRATQEDTAEKRQPPAQVRKPEDGMTFRQPFLLPAGEQDESRRGALTGMTGGRRASTSQGAAEKGSGDAAVSNYPGQVARRLNGALRYPSGAKTAHLVGETTVSFSVDGSGRASAISVVASSGDDVLDQAAIAAVRRASPFPPIPSAAGRSAWPFTVTLAFGK